MGDGHWFHWTVEDEVFTDRWEWEDDSGRYAWIDRVLDGDTFRYELHVMGRLAGTYDMLEMARVALRGEVIHGA